MNRSRNYGIDLLRLVLMFMISVLHVLGVGGVTAAVSENSAGYYLFAFVEAFVLCAVDGFAFISGYAASNKEQKTTKIIDLWMQVWFYSFVVSLLLPLVGVGSFMHWKVAIKRMLPFSFNIYWYFSAYCVLFFLMPMLNKYLFAVEEQAARKVFAALFAVPVVTAMLGDPMGLRGGYSAIWLIVLYCMGVLAKRGNLFERRKTATLLVLLILCNAVTWGSVVFLKTERLLQYVSPTVIASALLLTVIFSRLPLKGTLISKLSPLAFGIYLLQCNPVVWNCLIADSFRSAASKPLAAGMLMVLAGGAAIFVAGIVVEFVRQQVMKLLKLNRLAPKILACADALLSKSGALLLK